jgi:hypothetical protein
MNTKLRIGAVLLALALCILPVAAFHVNLVTAVLAGVSTIGLLGTVVVTYASFQDGSGPHEAYTGGTVAPTQNQTTTVNAVVAQVSTADSDTVALITHNFNVSTAQAAALQPYIQYYATTGAGTTPLTFALTSANVITVGKNGFTGSGGTYVVIIRRPYSASQ